MKRILFLSLMSLSFSMAVLAAEKPAATKAVAEKPAATKAAVEKSVANTTALEVATAVGVDAASASDIEQTYFDEFIDKVKKGGTTMLFLLAFSIAGISFILERLVNLKASRFATPGLVQKAAELYSAEKYDELEALCRKDKSILARMILLVIDHRECEISDIQNLASDVGSREIRLQLQKAYPLAIIATLSPLLGLFGTVIGMIGAFDTVASVGEMGNASVMAGDIAKALVTTAGGLVVAMPMLAFYHFFRSRTNRLAIGLEEDMAELFSAWFLKKKKL